MKILGVDYGMRRIGLATCGPLKIANPLKVIHYKEMGIAMTEMLGVIQEHEISKVVIGLPKNMDNTEGEMVKEVQKFAAEIKKRCEIEIDFCDERLSTWEAKNSLKNLGFSSKKQKKMLDAVAAALILQNYVDRKK